MGKIFTIAKRRKGENMAYMHQVCNWLEIDDLAYGAQMLKVGTKFLELIVSEDEVRAAMTTPQYWGWFKLHWYAMEQVFLDEVKRVYKPESEVREDGKRYLLEHDRNNWVPDPLSTVNGRRELWYKLHDAKALADMPEMLQSFGTINWEL